MKIIEHNKSSTRPVKILKGLSGSLYNTDIVTESTEESTIYDFTSYLFDNQEYDLLSVGILPPEATWDEHLREIERSFLYDEADIYISKYTTDVPDEEKRALWVAYKSAIRNSIYQENYPLEVTYPTRPE